MPVETSDAALGAGPESHVPNEVKSGQGAGVESEQAEDQQDETAGDAAQQEVPGDDGENASGEDPQ